MFGEIQRVAAGWSSAGIFIRLSFSLIAGLLIGLDRRIKMRNAGIKTHALVCIGAALVMITSQYLDVTFPEKADMSRMGAQVISGVGFLGVGTIITTGKNQVRGLTTAAGLWACACVGLAAGIGFLEGAVLTLILILVTLRGFSKIDRWLAKNARVFELYVELECNKNIAVFIKELHAMGVKLSDFEINKSKIKGSGPSLMVVAELPKGLERTHFMSEVRLMDYIDYVEEL